MKPVMLSVYGAENVCASCVNMPTAKDTYEWLEAALKRKYPNQPFEMQYIDIHEPPDNEHAKELAEKSEMTSIFIRLCL